MQDHLLGIWTCIWAPTGIGIVLIRPTSEVPGGVLVVVSASPQGNERLICDEDLLNALNGLLLCSRIGGRGVLVQVLVGCSIVPGYVVEPALANLSTIEVLIVQIVWSRATNHTAEHQLVVIFTVSA